MQDVRSGYEVPAMEKPVMSIVYGNHPARSLVHQCARKRLTGSG